MPNAAGSNENSCEGALSAKKIILGVTGSVAAYKAAYLASALVQRGADVHVVLTDHAAKLIGPATFWSLTGNPVVSDLFEPPKEREIVHISLPESADLFLVAPATANVIAKLAYGLADDMLSTMALAVRCPVVIAPAMNVRMYTSPVVAANIQRLRQYGHIIVEPGEGRLACGEEGIGRLADPEEILRVVEEALGGEPRDYAGINVLVTAGPTHEPIDPVRYITNRSSGKMGYAIAERAAARGASVTLVSGPTNLRPAGGVQLVPVTTVREMFEAVMQRANDVALVISAGAPADFTPAEYHEQKVKKTDKLTLELDKTVDVLAELGKNKGKKVLVGFAAETEDVEANARAKLEAKNLDLVVANDVSPGSETFGGDSNQVSFISRSSEKIDWPRMSKREVADAILDYVRRNLLEESS